LKVALKHQKSKIKYMYVQFTIENSSILLLPLNRHVYFSVLIEGGFNLKPVLSKNTSYNVKIKRLYGSFYKLHPPPFSYLLL